MLGVDRVSRACWWSLGLSVGFWQGYTIAMGCNLLPASVLECWLDFVAGVWIGATLKVMAWSCLRAPRRGGVA
jgi:hypothetical protein